MKHNTTLLGVGLSILAVQAIAANFMRRPPYLPSPPPLSHMPFRIGNWMQTAEAGIDPASLAALGPDDYLARRYDASGPGDPVEVFIAYYKSQLRAQNAHDPKLCLPGSGWNPVESRLTSVSTPSGGSFRANYYRVRRAGQEQVVIYWFQTPYGNYAAEQQLRARRVWDAMRYNRTDMALVRIIVPSDGQGISAENEGRQFAKAVYQEMMPYFPPSEQIR